MKGGTKAEDGGVGKAALWCNIAAAEGGGSFLQDDPPDFARKPAKGLPVR